MPAAPILQRARGPDLPRERFQPGEINVPPPEEHSIWGEATRNNLSARYAAFSKDAEGFRLCRSGKEPGDHRRGDCPGTELADLAAGKPPGHAGRAQDACFRGGIRSRILGLFVNAKMKKENGELTQEGRGPAAVGGNRQRA